MKKRHWQGASTVPLVVIFFLASYGGGAAMAASAEKQARTELGKEVLSQADAAPPGGAGERGATAESPPAEAGEAGEREAIFLDPLRVLGAEFDPRFNYHIPDTAVATKTDTPIMETPVSIQIVPQAIMEDQQVIRLEDALRNVSSVQPSGESMVFQNDFAVRGFPVGVDINSAIYRNGVRMTSVNFVPTGLEQVEVVKGPAAVLYGRIEPGALINAVTKKPRAERFYSLQQQFGSYDMYRTSLDATGAVDEEGQFLYRLNFDYLNRDSFRDFLFQDQVFVRPSFAWNLTPDTQLMLSYEYLKGDFGHDLGVPVLGNRPVDIPLSRNFSDPNFTRQKREDHIVELSLVHHFNEDWQINWQGVYANERRDQDTLFPQGVVDPETGLLERGTFGARLRDHETWSTTLNLTGHFDLLGTRHTLLVGGDYYNEERRSRVMFGEAPPINVFNPVYGNVPRLTFGPGEGFPFFFDNEWFGIYVQDQIALFDRLHLLVGARYDSTTATRMGQELKDDQFSPRFGLVYQFFPWLSVYGHYVEALGLPNAGLSREEELFEPERSQQYEVGFKTEFFQRRLSATVALFDLTKQNILTPDPVNPAFSLAIGEARSRGIELDVSGQVTDRLSLIGSYAAMDTEILRDTRDNEGNRLPNAPGHSGSLWAKYQATPQFNVGAGVFAVGRREIDQANTAQLPGYARVDAMASYQWKLRATRLTAQLNVFNLFDKEFFQSANLLDNATAFPGAPRTFIGSLRLDY